VVGVVAVGKVASVGVAVVAEVAVAVSNGSGHVGNNGVVGDLVGDEGAVVGVPGNMYVCKSIRRYLEILELRNQWTYGVETLE